MYRRVVKRNVWFIMITLAAIMLLVITGYHYYRQELDARQLIVIATGEPTSESYKIMQAIAQIINAEEHDFTIKVISTSGSVENARLLEVNLVNMATIQADLSVGSKTRLVANLYEEVFHFITGDDINISSIENVQGLKLAVPPATSGEYYSFMKLQEHFGFHDQLIVPVASTWKSATWLFMNGDIEAIFKVREANHEAIAKFVSSSRAHSEPITQSAAISLNYPMYHRSVIPRGAYQGIPPKPVANVETLGVDQLLVATVETPVAAVNAIATVLYTRRRELAEATKVAGLVKIPAATSLIPWHPGLVEFVNKEKPNFIQRNAEFLAFMLSVIILLGSSVLQFFNRAKQQRLNAYNEQLLSIKVNVEQTHSLPELYKLRTEHYALVNQIVGDAVQGRISGEGFEFFAFAWDSVTRMIKDKEKTLAP